MLQELKDIESQKKERVAALVLTELKAKCKQVIELKAEVDALLELLELDAKESKSVIDWVNSLSDVKLTEKKKQNIFDKISNWFSGKKDEQEKQPIKHSVSASSTTAAMNNLTTFTGGSVIKANEFVDTKRISKAPDPTITLYGQTFSNHVSL